MPALERGGHSALENMENHVQKYGHEPLYAVKWDNGGWLVYEKNPIPGGVDRAVIHRKGKREALLEARSFLLRNGSSFKKERSVVGF